MTLLKFSQLNLPDAQLANLESLEYFHMTPIQAEALPVALKDKDLIAQAKTGSGKTAVFALTILAKLDFSSRATQALVLCPTRELSVQVSAEIRRLARYQQNVTLTTLYGGQPVDLQKRSMRTGAQIVVATPGRLIDHLERGNLVLDEVNTLVLDEADRMLEMGFMDELEMVIQQMPAQRQTLFFSATYPENIQTLSQRYQRQPIRITVDQRHDTTAIDQHFYSCHPQDKLAALRNLLLHYQPLSVVVFCNFKQSTRDVCDFLRDEGFAALALNGDLEQRDREEVLAQFKHQSCTILVATDVAARGLDIKDLPMVVNYELSPDPEVYVHRIGRTGRAGKTGMALSLCGDREGAKLDRINDYQQTSIDVEPVPALPAGEIRIPRPTMATIYLSGGRKAKVRPGDVLGALTREGGVEGKSVGKIDVLDYSSFIAVDRQVAKQAEQQLRGSKIKGRSFKVWVL